MLNKIHVIKLINFLKRNADVEEEGEEEEEEKTQVRNRIKPIQIPNNRLNITLL